MGRTGHERRDIPSQEPGRLASAARNGAPGTDSSALPGTGPDGTLTEPERESVPKGTSTLDEAYERMASSGFELPNGFVFHGPMACEALAVLGCSEDVEDWSRSYGRSGGRAVDPVDPRGFDWSEALGDARRLPEWIGYFERQIEHEGWPRVVEVWVPRLVPALAVALFHGAIRSAHAIRAIDAADTDPRRAELARSLGYWAARFRQGHPALEQAAVEDVRSAVVEAAAEGARRYLSRPDIFNLHGVTGAMAVELLLGHVPEQDRLVALAQVRAEHAALYAATSPALDVSPSGVPQHELTRSAAASGDPHQVKLVEACFRGFRASADPVFAAAAETVTGLRQRRA